MPFGRIFFITNNLRWHLTRLRSWLHRCGQSQTYLNFFLTGPALYASRNSVSEVSACKSTTTYGTTTYKAGSPNSGAAVACPNFGKCVRGTTSATLRLLRDAHANGIFPWQAALTCDVRTASPTTYTFRRRTQRFNNKCQGRCSPTSTAPHTANFRVSIFGNTSSTGKGRLTWPCSGLRTF